VHLLYHCLEQPVLYQFTSWHPALHVPFLCTTCTFLCLRSRSFHVIHLFLNPLSRLLTCAVITRHLPQSHYISPRSLLHVIHISIIDTTCIQSLYTNSSGPIPSLLALSPSLLPRTPHPSSCPSHIHPPASCRIKLIIHISFTRIPYIVAKPRSALQKCPRFTAERTSLHLLDPFPTCSLVRVRLCRCPFCSLGSERREWVKMK
jgi:hypothetical protein